MNLFFYLKQSIGNLFRNPFRSFLAILGISIGIASVIVIYSIGEGFNETIKGEFSSLGADTIIISPLLIEQEGKNVSWEYTPIEYKNIESLGREFKEINYIVPTISQWNRSVSYKKNIIKTSIMGTTPEFILIGGKKIERGAFWGYMDVIKANNVCILGNTASTRIFENQDPVGKNISVEGVPLKVLGVMQKLPKRGFRMGDTDNSVIMPYTTFINKITGRKHEYINEARVMPQKGVDIDMLVENIKESLKKKLKIKKDEKIKFTVERSEEFGSFFTQMVGEHMKFLIMTACISLLIGGLGIMNIMLVSVTDRTREIGIRMSLGATRADIIRQFLIEAVILCIIGSLIGVALSYPLAGFMSKSLEYPSKISPGILFIAILYSCGIGIFFGLYPAYTASKLDPVEALRYE